MNTSKDVTNTVDDIRLLLKAEDFSSLRTVLSEFNPADLAGLFECLEEREILLSFRVLPKELAADTFSYMSSDLQMWLIQGFSDAELREVMEQTFIDDKVDLIEEMPANVVNRIIKNTPGTIRKQINEILNYPKDSAGSIMTTEYVILSPDSTVKEAFDHIRSVGVNKETVYTCYVTRFRKLIGLVTVKDLFLAKETDLISSIMETNVISVHTHDDKEDVAKQFNKYNYLAIPVVDNDNRIVGIVTFDDAMDVLQDENTEDITKMAAVSPSENSYFKTSVFTHAKNRIGWLLVLMLSATITGTIITKYENAIQTIPLLVSFIPMLMDTGGNCGAQSSTLIIRGLALDEIKMSDIFRVMYKEFRVSLLVSIALALVNGVRILIMYRNDPNVNLLALVIACSLVLTIIIAKMIGCLLPLAAKKIHVDPAIMASPLITTLVDTCSIFIYFHIAMRFFHL